MAQSMQSLPVHRCECARDREIDRSIDRSIDRMGERSETEKLAFQRNKLETPYYG